MGGCRGDVGSRPQLRLPALANHAPGEDTTAISSAVVPGDGHFLASIHGGTGGVTRV